jgi:hypothetical protein
MGGEKTLYGEHVLQRTHSCQYPMENTLYGEQFYGEHILRRTHSCRYCGRKGSPMHAQSRGPRAALLISPLLQAQILKSQ